MIGSKSFFKRLVSCLGKMYGLYSTQCFHWFFSKTTRFHKNHQDFAKEGGGGGGLNLKLKFIAWKITQRCSVLSKLVQLNFEIKICQKFQKLCFDSSGCKLPELAGCFTPFNFTLKFTKKPPYRKLIMMSISTIYILYTLEHSICRPLQR